MSDPALVTCEACGEDRLEKLISWTAFGGGSSSTQALYSANPREAVTGSVDRGRPPKKEPPAASAPATPASSSSDAAPSSDPVGDASGSDSTST